MNIFAKIRCVMVMPQNSISILNYTKAYVCFSVFGRVSGHTVYSDIRMSYLNRTRINSTMFFKAGSKKGYKS
jgi:hypothetical protein